MGSRVPIVAIVGRTNVGKSTLFNAIAGRRLAIVEDTPGVTRDRSYATVNRHGFPFTLVDTGGLAGEEFSEFEASVREQAELAIAEASVVIAVCDGTAGVHPQDKEVVELLRRAGAPVIWTINKCEKPSTEEAAVEFYALGIDSMHCVSAAHNRGIKELVELVRETLGVEKGRAEVFDDNVIRVGIVGKPNVGKSTLVNKLLGEQRVIASDIAGTTRDSIDVSLKRDGQEYVLVDTAGLRRKAKVKDGSVERYSNLRSLRAIARSDVAVLLLDATDGTPTEQDAKIAGLIHDRGIPMLVVVNKWDAIEKDHRTAKEFKTQLRETLKFAKYAPIIFVSALTGKRCPSILQKAKEIYEIAQIRIPTGELNRLITRAIEKKHPPVYRGEPIKMYFVTQVDVAPPTFVMFVNYPKQIPISYLRYLKNRIRKEYPYEGSNIKLAVRKRSDKEQRLRQAQE